MSKQIHSVASQGVQLQAYTWGDSKNTPIVLLHGYPDNHLVWQGVAERLAKQYYVVSYDVRGAGGSSKPKGRKHYKLDLLDADFSAVVNALLPNRSFHLAGHDWGSIQGWEFVTAGVEKARILSYTTISGPCLDHVGYWFRDRLNTEGVAAMFKQGFNSWYIAMFQLPVLPELVWRFIGPRWSTFLAKVEGVTEPETNPSQTDDGALGVWLYRANMVPKLLKPEQRYARCPIQLLVPTKDRYVSTALFDDLTRWVDELYRRDIDACHWVTLAETDKVAHMITEFVTAVEEQSAATVLTAYRVKDAVVGTQEVVV